ncbi:MAG: DUF3443 domain-containing protein [Pseudomonadota bacterium]|nr:DUF3443 domain-containing protein [Pseudomonadota bacterium]
MTRVLGLWAAVCLAAAVLAGCGGGGGGGGGGGDTTSTSTNNVAAVTVDAGLTGRFVNVVTTSVTLCVPGTTNCQTIPNVLVDTGSSGLRLLASAIKLPLPAVASASGTYHECADFADGTLWGSVVLADTQLAGEKAASMSLQMIQDNAAGPAVPASCSAKGTPENSLALLGANGILGVGFFLQDCGTYCSTVADAIYYDCNTAGSCTGATIAIPSQVANPVALFAQDNNGVILQLAAIPDGGTAAGTGTLTFGIGTQANNALSGTVLPVPSSGTSAGFFTAVYQGTTRSHGILDSGSSSNFFNDTTLPKCPSTSVAPGFYCPGSAAALSLTPFSATLTGANGGSVTVSGTVANAEFLFNQTPTLNAFDDVAGPAGTGLSADSFDLGVPFFFGKRITTAFEHATTPAGPGPFVAF